MFKRGGIMRFYRERSLEDLCLNTVVANLGISYSPSELGEKYNNFLRKRYSDRIYNILKKNGCLDENLIGWLISPYWNDVIVEKTCSISKLIPKFIAYGNKITSVSFENSLTTVEILSAVVCLLPHLKSLNLNGTSCTDDLLTLIRKMCPELASLSLFECNVTDEGMKNLCYVNRKKVGFDSLNILNIEKTKVQSNGIACILKNLNLQIIKYPDIATILYYFHLSKVNKSADISKIYELKELEYCNKLLPTISFNKILEVWVGVCPNVEKLEVAVWLCDCDFDLCLKFENLKSFKFAELPDFMNPPSKDGLAYFLENRGEKLTELYLQNVSVSVEVIGRVCLNLQKLTLNKINYQDIDETVVINDEMHHLNSLAKLSIKNSCMYNKSTNKSINFLLSISKNIKSVSFHCVRNLSEVLVDNIINMEHLVKAKFVFTDIKDNAAVTLFTCKNIQKLYFDGCPYVCVEKCADIFCSHVKSNMGNTFSWQLEYDERIT